MKNMKFLRRMMSLSGRTWTIAAAFVVATTISSTAYGQTLPGVFDFTACKTGEPVILLCTPVWNLPILAPETSIINEAEVHYNTVSKVLEITGIAYAATFLVNGPGGPQPQIVYVSGGASTIRGLVNPDGSFAGGVGDACGDARADDFCLSGTVTDPSTGTQYGPGVLLRGTIEHFVFRKQAIANGTYTRYELKDDGTCCNAIDTGIQVPWDDFEFHIRLTGGDLFNGDLNGDGMIVSPEQSRPDGIWNQLGTDNLAIQFFGWSPRASDPEPFGAQQPYTGDNPFLVDFTELFGFAYVGPTIVTAGLFNAPPSVDAGSSVSGAEGSAIGLGGTASDPDGNTVTTTWTASSPKCSFSLPNALNTTITCTDNGVYTATLIGTDGVGPPVADATTVTVANVAPTVTIAAPTAGALYPLGSAVNISVKVSDAGASDTHTCSIKWDDGITSSGTVAETNGSGTCTASHAYAAAGVYSIETTVTDDDRGAPAISTVMIVVYDPSAGFITGGGWYDSLPGADVLNPAATGQAYFGFVAKYKKGATVPDGATMFQFRAGNLLFQSTAYEWLVVTGGCYAQYKGTGTVNGVPGYSFMFTVRDGRLCGSATSDGIRVKITGPGGLRYDNVRGAPDDIGDTSGSVQAIAGGSIVIHR